MISLSKKNIPLLFLITDRNIFFDEKSFLKAVKSVIDFGVDIIQIREKNLATIELFDLTNKIKKIADKSKTKLIINDRVDIMLSCDLDGVHLSWKSLPINIVRKLIGEKKIIGVSIHSLKELKKIDNKAVDYATISPIYFTPSKADYLSPLGITKLRNAVKISDVPLIALGGINADNLKEVLATGVVGVAFVRPILDVKEIKEMDLIRNFRITELACHCEQSEAI